MNLQKKAHFWAKILSPLPGVLAIFLSGSVAQNKSTKKSDIDFFIIAQEGQIWTARFFVFLVLKICGQISTEKDHAQKICPNHFITHDHLEIEEKEPYSANLFSSNTPLHDPYYLYTKFVQRNKTWIRNFGESFPELNDAPATKRVRKTFFFEKWIERLLKLFQIWKIKRNKDFKRKGAKIILNDNELRFHPKPKKGQVVCSK